MNWQQTILFCVSVLVAGALVYVGKLDSHVLALLVGVLVPTPMAFPKPEVKP